MTPANYVADLIRATSEALGYKVFTNHMPDSPDRAVCVYDQPTGRVEPRSMVSGESWDHPTVQIVVRGTSHDAADIMPDLWDYMKSAYMYEFLDGKILQCITKANTMGSLGHEPQTRRTKYTQQFRMTFLE